MNRHFFKRKYTDVQKASEKVLNMTHTHACMCVSERSSCVGDRCVNQLDCGNHFPKYTQIKSSPVKPRSLYLSTAGGRDSVTEL